ncbi:dienelactone hydrolase family protein, partial [Acinetobacter baumannii]|uniref:dienelactone hydrolase family protein n=1 Tax=Acinetobacter baumannii TaxID=470 RepID=UPI001899AC78
AVANETPKVPAMMHFGAKDAHIPLSDVEKLKSAQPGLPVHVYNADHGFNCDQRASYDKASADEAMGRTLAFFAEHLA